MCGKQHWGVHWRSSICKMMTRTTQMKTQTQTDAATAGMQLLSMHNPKPYHIAGPDSWGLAGSMLTSVSG